MQNIFFFQTQQIPDSSIFNQLKEQKIFYSYFQVDQNYYLFLFSQTNIQIDFLYSVAQVIEELDSKQRKIRSLRGFFLYALEILENGDNYEILDTNLQPFFWRKVQNIIRQNKKGALLQFLFGYTEASNSTYPSSSPGLDAKIQILQNQVDSLAEQVERLQQKIQQKIIQLESKLENPKYAPSEPSQPLEYSKAIQQGHYTLEGKKELYLPENDPKRSAVRSEIRDSTSRRKDIESKTLSEASKIDFKDSKPSQPYNISSNQQKGLNGSNFITLGKISEQERIEIIQRGFQLQAEGKISLKKYYESKDPNSLFQSKRYSIKYESIRRTKLYQQLKE